MNAAVANVAWRLIGKPVALNGFAYGSHYPVLVVAVTGYALTQEQLAAVSKLLQEVIPDPENAAGKITPANIPEDGFRASVEWILTRMLQIQRAAGLPIHERGQVISLDHSRARFWVPTGPRSVKPLLRALHVVLALLEYQFQEGKSPSDHLKRLAQVYAELKRASPGSSNVPRFARAALELGIPLQELPGQVFQYGYGKRARWMDSSFTDETPQIAAKLARNKQMAAAVLRQAGIPVPAHKVAVNAEAALRIAEQLGYPVVVKPADLDGGVGVAAGLLTPEEVTAAFQSTQKHSKNVLVEKYVEGKDYRVTVFHGEVIWAVERVPGGVTGDGRHTVQELVEQLNADPRRGEGTHAPMKRLVLDEEAAALLQRAGLDVSAVPASGQFVRLRRAANVASGGTPVAVFDQIHPENCRLAVRTAAALRLDLAGVDLLIPDISRSWRETGAAICEVNGQPHLGQVTTAHLYVPILRKLVPGDGRVPVAVVLGAAPTDKLVRNLELRMLREGMAAGCHDGLGVRVNGEEVLDGEVSPFVAGQALAIDRSVGAVVLSINDASVLRTGLPFSRFDVLVLAGSHIGVPDESRANVLSELLAAILPACDGKVLNLETSRLSLNGFENRTSAQWEHSPLASGTEVDVIVKALVAAVERHGAPLEYQRNSIPVCW